MNLLTPPARSADGSFPEGALVAVLTAQPLDRLLDYKAPEGGCVPGSYVEVPLGPRTVIGVVWGPGRGDYDYARTRAVGRVLDLPPMPEEMRDFLERAGAYTLTPMHAMLRLATRAPGLGEDAGTVRLLVPGGPEPARMTDARRKVMDALGEFDGQPVTRAELSAAAGVTSSVIKGLLDAGTLAEVERPRDPPYAPLDPDRPGVELTEAQEHAAIDLRAKVRGGGYGTTLLKGVTGSGKTEVYLEAVAECLRRGRQALVLLPEIALTSEFVARVERRFGAKPAEWHSGVTGTERRRCFRRVAEGQARLVVGARSALFLPYADLGLVVVDEEHDPSYKQEDGVLYNARDMAVLRASHARAQVILASATPSLETWVNAKEGRYDRLVLGSRFGAGELPMMRAVDLRRERLEPSRWIGPTLAEAMRERLDRGEQSLVFLNRRGYAPVQVCRACGHQIGCHQCDARMVEHRFRKLLMCHQCGETRPMPAECPECGVEGKLAPVGPGVERMAEEVAERFPEARVAILSSDLYGSARQLKAEIEEIAKGAADIVIGTQLVAKGHNFPLLTLVGVIDADLGLQGSDLRAAERTFALMRQVAGRAGRMGAGGVALLQSAQPEHPVIKAILAGAEEDFWAAEAAERRAIGVPPYGRMAGIVVSSPEMHEAYGLAEEMARRDEPLRRAGAELWGPAAAPIALVRGRHRVRLLVKADRGVPIQAAVADWLSQFRWPATTRVSVDVDPQSFL
ncbi:primosomal protein N' [Hasllibacter halocynthiae]|nr:primosomal protein N' [Hasllibacter halocynthiae]